MTPRVELLTHTPDPEKIVASAAKLCYSDSEVSDLMDNMTKEKSRKFINMLMGLGHESPIEHITFTFAIEGVSRAFLAQITRHRIASFSVQSQRYVKYDKYEYITPPSVMIDPNLNKFYDDAIKKAVDAYKELSDHLYNVYMGNEEFRMQNASDPEGAAEKRAIEDARFLLPNAFGTRMIVTMNARSLMNFFSLRTCNRAQWEIRDVARQMLALCYEVAPSIFKKAGPSCVRGACGEGKMCCGKMVEVRQEIHVLKNNNKLIEETNQMLMEA